MPSYRVAHGPTLILAGLTVRHSHFATSKMEPSPSAACWTSPVPLRARLSKVFQFKDLEPIEEASFQYLAK